MDVKDYEKSRRPKAATGIHVWLLLWKATKAIQIYAYRSVKTFGMGLSDFGVLEALFHKGPLPVNALGKKILLTSGSMTTAVDRLVRRGLVKRADDATDRRTRVVHLTEAGSKLIGEIFVEHSRDMERAVSCLDGHEIENLVTLLRKLGRGADALLTVQDVGTQTPAARHTREK
jgi:MarR family transcriptional regulator, 2-MHQ and catechol-resistance regulon repressor